MPSGDHIKYIDKLRWWLQNYENWITDPDIPVGLHIIYYLLRPKSAKREYPTTKPDIDNLSKTMLDALKPKRIKREIVGAGVIPDDAQIIKLYQAKLYAKKQPKIKITLWIIPSKRSKQKLEDSLIQVPYQPNLMLE